MVIIRSLWPPRGGPVTLPGSPGTRIFQPPPRALPCTLSTGVSMTPVLTEPITSFLLTAGVVA
jgi:hypothetical protein